MKMNTIWPCLWKAYSLENPKTEQDKNHERYTNRKCHYAILKAMIKLSSKCQRTSTHPTGGEGWAMEASRRKWFWRMSRSLLGKGGEWCFRQKEEHEHRQRGLKMVQVSGDIWNINISNKGNSLSRCLKCFKSVELCKFFHMTILTDFFNPSSYDEYWFLIGKYGHCNSSLSIFWYPNI